MSLIIDRVSYGRSCASCRCLTCQPGRSSGHWQGGTMDDGRAKTAARGAELPMSWRHWPAARRLTWIDGWNTSLIRRWTEQSTTRTTNERSVADSRVEVTIHRKVQRFAYRTYCSLAWPSYLARCRPRFWSYTCCNGLPNYYRFVAENCTGINIESDPYLSPSLSNPSPPYTCNF